VSSGGKTPSVKLMSRRENKELAKTNLKNMDKTMQELQHIGSLKDFIISYINTNDNNNDDDDC